MGSANKHNYEKWINQYKMEIKEVKDNMILHLGTHSCLFDDILKILIIQIPYEYMELVIGIKVINQ